MVTYQYIAFTLSIKNSLPLFIHSKPTKKINNNMKPNHNKMKIKTLNSTKQLILTCNTNQLHNRLVVLSSINKSNSFLKSIILV